MKLHIVYYIWKTLRNDGHNDSCDFPILREIIILFWKRDVCLGLSQGSWSEMVLMGWNHTPIPKK